MTIDSNILLRQLEPAVRPAYMSASPARAAAPIEQQSFDDLLAKASSGRLASERPVTAAFEAGEPLSPQQMARLGPAADLAEAAGARTALMLVDGRGLVLDVAARTLAEELAAPGASRVVKVDAAVIVAGGPEQD